MMNYIKYINILNDDNASRNPVKGYEGMVTKTTKSWLRFRLFKVG